MKRGRHIGRGEATDVFVIRDRFSTVLDSKARAVVKVFDLDAYPVWAVTRRTKIRSIWKNKRGAERVRNKSKRDKVRLILTWITRNKIQCAEFFLECRINKLIYEHILKPGISPHFIQQVHDYHDTEGGTLIFHRAHTNLEMLLNRLTLRQTKAALFQCIAALHVAQEILGLKHHDLHSSNVFVHYLQNPPNSNRKDIHSLVWQGRHLAEHSHFCYFINEQWYRIPNYGWLLQIGDLGYAAATDPETRKRVQRADYSFYQDDDIEWGQWGGNIKKQHGYDLQVLLSTMIHNTTRMRVRNRRWLKNVLRIIEDKDDAYTSRHHRPLPNRVSDIYPYELFPIVFKEFQIKNVPEVGDAIMQ